MSSPVLVHFDPRLEIQIACDSSSYGLGAVLSYQIPDVSEKLVAFMYRTLNKAKKKYSPMQPWSWPANPWSHLHTDFTGPMAGEMILVVVDARSKMKAYPMATATATTTIQQLRQLFAQFGIPQSIVSEYGPQFAAVEFENFGKLNGIHHI